MTNKVRTISHPEFRTLFPATTSAAWLDTPGSPPGAQPVVDALIGVLAQWSEGDFDWLAWDSVPQQARTLIAAQMGVAEDNVALMASVSEAAATVAGAIPPGEILMLENEYRSVLFPFMRMQSERHQVTLVPTAPGANSTQALIEALTPGTSLIAVSEVLSSDGIRLDLSALRAAADAVGARLFVDCTQAFGVLATDYATLAADYVAFHGYKWLLCPRGTAALIVRPDRADELEPLAPGWKSTALPHGYFGGSPDLVARSAMRLDSSPAWFSWIGACAALNIHASLDHTQVEKHTTGLAQRFVDTAKSFGYSSPAYGLPSHIAVLNSPVIPHLPDLLRERGVRAAATETRLRIGVHYFNNDDDIDRVLDVLSQHRPRT